MSLLKKIAAELNVAPSTISRALRNDPRISTALRRKVAVRAKELNYSPDPEISKTMQRIRNKGDAVRNVIAVWWPGSLNEKQHRRHYPVLSPVIDAIKKTASTLNISVETPDIIGKKNSAGIAARIYRTRGVRAIILMAGLPELYDMPAEFEGFSRIAIGNSIEGTVPVRVACHFEDAYASIFEQLHQRGYRRPGVILREGRDHHYEMRYLGAYEHYLKRLKLFEPVPVFDTINRHNADFQDRLHNWISRYRPDAIVSPHYELYRMIRNMPGHHIPGNLGYAGTGTSPLDPEISAPHTPADALGREAVFALNNLLMNPLHDEASPQTRILIKTTWHEGSTLPAKTNTQYSENLKTDLKT